MKKDWKTVAPRAFVIAFILLAGCSSANDRTAADTRPPEARARMFLLIDEKTFEVIERTKPEWDELYSEELDRWRNPDTGEYTIVPGIKCDSCGKLVPVKKLSEEEKEGLSEEQIGMRSEQLMRQYVCPHCEGRVYQ